MKMNGRVYVKKTPIFILAFFMANTAPMARAGNSPVGKRPTHSQLVRMKKTVGEIDMDYRGKVEPIFKSSCFDCHSNSTRYPWYHNIPGIKQMIDNDVTEARKHIDMSNGYPFKGHGNLESDLKAIAYQVEKGNMPPTRYRMMHPASGMTKKKKQEIEDWVERSLDKLDEAGF